MASVTSINNGDVVWDSTNGNLITFRVTADVVFGSGQYCIKSDIQPLYNTNFPQDVPEMHFSIVEDASGTNTVSVDETITVTMDDINDDGVVKLVILEGGNVKGHTVYHEDPVTKQRG